MKNKILNCNNCGELLRVNNNEIHTTCQNCNQQLEIIKDNDNVYTKGSSSNRNEIYKQIELLDRTWQNELPTYTKYGTLPDLTRSNERQIATSVFGFLLVGWMLNLLFNVRDAGITIILIILVIGIHIANLNRKRRNTYEAAKSNYKKKRDWLLERLD